ncbi:unnamed protein product, partial [Ectocarpus sp. 8 AP-2014]
PTALSTVTGTAGEIQLGSVEGGGEGNGASRYTFSPLARGKIYFLCPVKGG